MSGKPPFNGFETANTTPVPDVLFDELLPSLTEAELKVLLYIIRRTAGFKKTDDAISLSQFQKGITKRSGEVLDKGCGIKNRTVISKALTSLEKMGCIKSNKGDDSQGDKATTTYSIHFRAEGVVSKSYQGSIQIVPPVVSKTHYGSAQNALGVVSKSYPQETVIQETDSQETVIQEEGALSFDERTARTRSELIDDINETGADVIDGIERLTESGKHKAVTAATLEGAANEQQNTPSPEPVAVAAPTSPAASVSPPSSNGTAQRAAGGVNGFRHIIPDRPGQPTQGTLPEPRAPDLKVENAREIKRRIEEREREIWSLVERELGKTFSKTQRAYSKHAQGMQNLIEDETTDADIVHALKAMMALKDSWLRENFTLTLFHARMPNLLPAQQAPPTSEHRNFTGEAKRLREKLAAQAASK